MTAAIVVAVYNGIKYLKEQLVSIMEQTRPADEVILCDDGSTDGSTALMEAFIASHNLGDTWKLYRNKQNLGYIRNFYQGIEISTADIIFLADQDDLWRREKVAKMMSVMESHGEISLLSCHFGVINEAGEEMSGLMVERTANTGELTAIGVDDVLRSFHWLGMTMALRRDFFEANAPVFRDLNVPHDFIFAIFGAEQGTFYEYHYRGCDHRRHGDNLAEEEHRVLQLLNLKRKLHEMSVYNEMLSRLIKADLPLALANPKIKAKYDFNLKRAKIVWDRQFFLLLKLYRGYGKVRLKSFLCDLWLICFGDYKSIKKND